MKVFNINQIAGLSKLLQILYAGLNIFFTAFFLSNFDRGIFYTLSSIVAIQSIFELGFSNIILQYVSRFSLGTISLGIVSAYDNKVFDFYRFIVNLYFKLGTLLFIVIIVYSYFLFKGFEFDVKIITAVITLSFTTTLTFIFFPNMSFVEALGDQNRVWRFRLLQILFNLLFLIFFYSLNFGLLAFPLATLLSLLIAIYLFGKDYFKFLTNIYSTKQSSTFNYKIDILPYQFKIGISWISGYFIYQIINPLVFKFQGAENAGKYGLTFAIFSGIQSVGLVFVATSIPRWSKVLSVKSFSFNDIIIDFKSVLIKALTTTTILSLIFILILLLDIRYTKFFYFKFLDFISVIYLSLGFVFSLLSYVLASLIRCKLHEPFVKVSVFIALASLVCFYYGSVMYWNIAFVFLIIMSINLFLVYKIFQNEIRKLN